MPVLEITGKNESLHRVAYKIVRSFSWIFLNRAVTDIIKRHFLLLQSNTY